MKNVLFFLALLPLGGCAALNSGHFPTDVQERVLAIPDGRTIFVVPLMGDTLHFRTIGVTIFGNSVAYLKVPGFAINQTVSQVVNTELNKYKRLRVEMPTAPTLHVLQAHVSPDRPPKIKPLLALAEKKRAAYLMVIWAGGSLGTLFGKSDGGVGYGLETQKVFNKNFNQIYCVERMAIYNVTTGRSLGNLVAVKQSKTKTTYGSMKPSKIPPQMLSKIETQVMSFAQDVTITNLDAFALSGYFAKQQHQ